MGEAVGVVYSRAVAREGKRGLMPIVKHGLTQIWHKNPFQQTPYGSR